MSSKILLVTLWIITPLFILANDSRLLRQPDISDQQVTFTYSNNIWTCGINGGDAQRLTTFEGTESNPRFSPDGRWIAFSSSRNGSTNVFVKSLTSGEIRQLTYHPYPDIVKGWTPDGRVLFTSGREGAPIPYSKFYTIGIEGGMPDALPIPRGHRGDFSADGNYFAYEMVAPVDEEWRNYRGGQNRPIWLMDMEDFSVRELPTEDNSKNYHPVWIENTIYFLSDRDHTLNIYSWNMETEELQQRTFFSEFDIKNLNSGGGKLVFEYAGYIYRMDPDRMNPRKLNISVSGDFPWARPQWKGVSNYATNASLSPTGVRAVMEARGEIFTLPSDKGDWRNLTNSPGARDRQPIWSPDGARIAWFSDQDGDYQLVLDDQDGMGDRQTITLPEPTFNYTPSWSPDSKYIFYTDANLKLWLIDLQKNEVRKIDQGTFLHPMRTMDPVWSPDSRWIVYAKRLPSQFHVLMAYSLEDNEIHQLTDGLSDAVSPAFDASGKYLYFLASTDFGLNSGWLDMSSYDRPMNRAAYIMVLQKDEPSPLLPESDEEPIDEEENESENEKEDGKEEDNEEEQLVQIDFEGLNQRILSLNIPKSNYQKLIAATEGVIFLSENKEGQRGFDLHRYDLSKRESETYLTPLTYFTVSFDGKKLLYQANGQWGIVDAGGKVSVGDGRINVSSLKMRWDPIQEWRQIFDEAWRIQRDYLYVDNFHGADWEAVYQMYEPMLDHLNHREDLNYLLDIIGGEVAMGHSFVGGGDIPSTESHNIGLLGADYTVEHGHYKIEAIYTGENWNPELRAPLSAPGIDVSEGNFLLAVNGKAITTEENLYSYFENTAGRQTQITVNDQPKMENARTVTVVPISNESGLRRLAWVENNRRKVDEMSDGKLAYVWLPNTAMAGYSYFNRYYFSQQDKKGAIIDERFNGGGSAADYMVDIMGRELHGFFNNSINPELPFTSPGAGIWGPKVMIINEAAGSGGDLLPYMFRKMEIGPLVGTTTWGGLIGIWDYPALIDGGMITAPRGAFFDLQGEWSVENEGVDPDIEVEMTPSEVMKGKDPQLEKAVEEALRLLETEEVEILPEPEAPIRVKRPRE